MFESVFAVGSKHQATVVKVEGGHAVTALPYGLVEGTCHTKHLVKQDGSTLGVDNQDRFVVLEFNRNAKRITVEPPPTYEEGPAKADTPKKSRSSSGGGSGFYAQMDEVNASIESTFGDLDVLTALKEQMEGDPEEAKEAKKPAKRLRPKSRSESCSEEEKSCQEG